MDITIFYKDFGRRLREARKAADLTQMALAERVGLSRASITNIENGRQHIHLHTFMILAEAVNADPTFFLPETGSVRIGVYEKLTSVGLDDDIDTVSWVEKIVSSTKKEDKDA